MKKGKKIEFLDLLLAEFSLAERGGIPPLNRQNPLSSFWQLPLVWLTLAMSGSLLIWNFAYTVLALLSAPLPRWSTSFQFVCSGVSTYICSMCTRAFVLISAACVLRRVCSLYLWVRQRLHLCAWVSPAPPLGTYYTQPLSTLENVQS